MGETPIHEVRRTSKKKFSEGTQFILEKIHSVRIIAEHADDVSNSNYMKLGNLREKFDALIKKLSVKDHAEVVSHENFMRIRSLKDKVDGLGKKFSDVRENIVLKIVELVKQLKLLSVGSHQHFYASPTTATAHCGLMLESRRYKNLSVKIGTAPTEDDEQTLSIDVKIDGSSILESPYVIDEDTPIDTFIEIYFKSNRAVKGSIVTMELTHTSGTANTLADVHIAELFQKLL